MTNDAKADEATRGRVSPIVGLSITGTMAVMVIVMDFCAHTLVGPAHVSGMLMGFAIGMFTAQLIARRVG